MIEIVTKPDMKAVAAVNRSGVRRIIAIFGGATLIMALLGAILYVMEWQFFAAVLFGFAGMVLILFIVLLIASILTFSKNKKTAPLLADNVAYYSFDGYFMYAKLTNPSRPDQIETIPAYMFSQAVELKEYFYLTVAPAPAYPPSVVTKSRIYYLPKKDFVSGTPDQLRAILQSWLPGKYKRYGKKSKK